MTNSTISTPDDNGYTPLMKAAQIGNMDDVHLLLTAGADPNIQSMTINPLRLRYYSNAFFYVFEFAPRGSIASEFVAKRYLTY